MDSAQGSDLAPSFGDVSQIEKLSEINPPLSIMLFLFTVGMAKFPLVAIPLVFLFAHGTFCENDFSQDLMKRLDFLESSNLKMKSQLGVIREGIILQSDELKEVSITFDKLQDQVQGFLPKTSFGK